ncbi:MAG: hypothetical protein LLF90_10405 [Methanomicrobiaceae archaeon]|nr:hypothetical protein [Methanomicrobiaceae archaeon]
MEKFVFRIFLSQMKPDGIAVAVHLEGPGSGADRREEGTPELKCAKSCARIWIISLQPFRWEGAGCPVAIHTT